MYPSSSSLLPCAPKLMLELLLLEISMTTLATATSPLQVVPALGQSSACRFAFQKLTSRHAWSKHHIHPFCHPHPLPTV